LNARYKHSETIAHRKVADEVLLVPIATEASNTAGIYTLNPTATMMWELMDGEHTLDELTDELSKKFDADPEIIHSDLETLIQDLLSFGALVSK